MAIERRITEALSVRGFFHEQWLQLIKLLGVEVDSTTPDVTDRQALGVAVDAVVQGTDARMRAVGSYQRRLRAGTHGLLEHIDDLVNQMPAALRLSRKSYVYDPQVNAFFSSMDQVKQLCQQSSEVNEYISSSCSGSSEPFYALLFLNYSETKVFTAGLQGDILQLDVQQTGIFFSGHRFLAPAASEAEIRQSLKRILFENVVEYLKRQLVLRRRAETEQQSSDIAVTVGANNPTEYLNTLVELLELPLDLVCRHERAVRINQMGIELPDSDESMANDIHLQQLNVGEENNSLITLVEILLE
ncbi:MAG: hypothetical protein GY751_03235 [Bacteroidetes bacterium]|nr:hypothetical protein [Bacteroidota bacterium]